jgi:hypothetical protein
MLYTKQPKKKLKYTNQEYIMGYKIHTNKTTKPKQNIELMEKMIMKP